MTPEKIHPSGIPSGHNPEDGFILIVAIAILSILAVLSMQYAQLARSSSERTRMATDYVSGFYAAEAGVERAKSRLAADTSAAITLQGTWHDASACAGNIAGWTISVKISDEASRISLNTVDAGVLSRLFEQFGMSREDRDVLAASLLDWIDANDLHRMNGAESDYYKSHGFPYGAKNAPLESINEILQVRGVPPDLLNRAAKFKDAVYLFSDCVTVTGDTRVNINTAPPPVLAAIGCSTDEVSAILKTRAKTPFAAVSDLGPILGSARAETLKPFLRVSSNWFYVESTASRPAASPVAVFGRFRRIGLRIYTAGFWS